MQPDDDLPTEAELHDAVNDRLVGLSGTMPASLREDGDDVVAALGKFVSGILGGATGGISDYLLGRMFPRTTTQKLVGVATSAIRRLEGHNRRLRRVERRLDELGPQHQALFVEGVESAQRATSEERIAILGAIIGDGLSSDELQAEFERSHIRLLNTLTDRDLETLRLIRRPQDRPPHPEFGPDYHRQVTYGNAIHNISIAHLRSAGLIEEPVTLRETARLSGPPKPSLRREMTQLTPLGKSLLIRVEEAIAPVPEPELQAPPPELPSKSPPKRRPAAPR